MKMKKRSGPVDFDRDSPPGEYDPDDILADVPDTSEDFKCKACDEPMVRTGDGWTCSYCHPDITEPGDME